MNHHRIGRLGSRCLGIGAIGLALQFPQIGWSQSWELITGPRTSASYSLGTDIVKTAKRLDLRLRDSHHPLDALAQLGRQGNDTLIMAPSDLQGYLRRSDKPQQRQLATQLQAVFALHTEEVHLLVRRDIRRFNDLRGRRLILGETHSDHWITATNLLQMTGLKPGQIRRLPPYQAALAVLRDEADAMLLVADAPAAVFLQLNRLRQQPRYRPLFDTIHFIPLDLRVMTDEYVTTTLNRQLYPWVDRPVPTIAIRVLLMTKALADQDSHQGRANCQRRQQLAATLRQSLPILRRLGQHQWQEVDERQRLPGRWQWDSCLSPVE